MDASFPGGIYGKMVVSHAFSGPGGLVAQLDDGSQNFGYTAACIRSGWHLAAAASSFMRRRHRHEMESFSGGQASVTGGGGAAAGSPTRAPTIGRLQAALEEDGAANTLFKGLNCLICHENQ